MALALLSFLLLTGCAHAIVAPVQSISVRNKPRLSDISNETPLQLFMCDGSYHQQWEINTLTSDKTIRLLYNDKCIDIAEYGTTPGTTVWLYDCHTSDKQPQHQNQEFVWTSKGEIISTLSGLCVAPVSNGNTIGTLIQLSVCDGDSNQLWSFNSSDSTIRGSRSGLCLDAGSPLPRPCDINPGKSYPYCNWKLPMETRVADLVSRIPLDEKYGLFGNAAAGVPSLGIPPYEWWSEALHGVADSPGVNYDTQTPYTTSFPQVCLTGASFDKQLWHEIGTAISTEARAMNNVGNAGLTFWAPNLNLFRDPRWGRGQETPGEDPHLTTEYVINFVTGLQGNSDKYLKVSACCKHYAGYDLENWMGMDRYHFDAIINDQDMQDTYLPAFHACVSPDAASGSGMMCSYNAVNGVPSCANDWLLTQVARQQFGFNGYITGDCGAVDCVQNTHHYTQNSDETCRAVLSAGTDIDCGYYLQERLAQATADGAVNTSLIDIALTHLFTVQMRLGIFDPESLQPYMSINTTAINSPAHQKLAFTAALEGIVLLKNDGNTLPLGSDNQPSVLLTGPNANATVTMQGNYFGNAPYLISPLQAISEVYTTKFIQGCNIADNDTSEFEEACVAAASSDVVIAVVGLDQSQESEGNDRTIINFPGVQEEFIEELAGCSKNPIVLVVMSGGPVDLTNAKNNPKVGAILWVGYPGQSGGEAIAKILFGDVSPSGRLPYTIYPTEYANQVSMEDMNMRPNDITGNPGRTYRFYQGEAVYEFGYGLSYTKFQYSSANSSFATVSLKEITQQLADPNYNRFTVPVLSTVGFVVKNVGDVASDVSVLAFLSGPGAGNHGRPIKSLVGFERVHSLRVSDEEIVYFPLTAYDLSLVNENGVRVAVAGKWTVTVESISITIVVA